MIPSTSVIYFDLRDKKNLKKCYQDFLNCVEKQEKERCHIKFIDCRKRVYNLKTL